MKSMAYPSGSRFPNAWKVGDLLFTSGQVALGSDGKIVGPGDIELQTKCAFENLCKVLRDAGCGTRNLIKLNTYLVFEGREEDFEAYWGRMSSAREAFLVGSNPAATAVRVAGFFKPGLLIEIDGIALLPTGIGVSAPGESIGADQSGREG
jgi:enamine deaminase RidA (YjgF/YER057c/UK114 family)